MGLISRPKLIAPPQFAPVCFEREILKQKQHVVARQLQAAKSYRAGRLTKSRLPQGQIKGDSKPLMNGRRIHAAEI